MAGTPSKRKHEHDGDCDASVVEVVAVDRVCLRQATQVVMSQTVTWHVAMCRQSSPSVMRRSRAASGLAALHNMRRLIGLSA